MNRFLSLVILKKLTKLLRKLTKVTGSCIGLLFSHINMFQCSQWLSLIKQVINDKYPVEDLYIKVIRD